MILHIILVIITVILIILSLLILYITVIPKQYREMRKFPLDVITTLLFYAKLTISTVLIFLLILGCLYLLNPKPIRVPIFLYAYFACGIFVFINAILWYFIYNVQIKKPLQYGHNLAK